MSETATPTVSTADLVARYIKIRDTLDAKKKAYEADIKPFKEALDKIENHFLARLNESGEESVRTAAGTFFKSTLTSYKVDDWNAMLKWIIEKELWHMLEKRVNKTAVVEYREANSTDEDDAIPPGLSVYRETSVKVHRPT